MKNQRLINLWLKEGIFVDGEDGAPMWSQPRRKWSQPYVLTLMYYLPFEGRERFEECCKNAGYNPKTLLKEFGLQDDEEHYGEPFTVEEI